MTEPTASLITLLRRHTGKGINDLRQAISTQLPILDEQPRHNEYSEFCSKLTELLDELEAKDIRYVVEVDGERRYFGLPRGTHLTSTLEELQKRLTDASPAAFNAVRELAQLAKYGDGSALETLVRYGRSHDNVREFIVSELAHAAAPRHTILLSFFKEGLRHPDRGYWSILGYIRVAETEAYRDLVDLALDTGVGLGTASPCGQMPGPARTPAVRS